MTSENFENSFREIVDKIAERQPGEPPEIRLYKVRIDDSPDMQGLSIDLLISIYDDEIHVATRPADFPEYSWSRPFFGKRV
jgi:hypothetical protein